MRSQRPPQFGLRKGSRTQRTRPTAHLAKTTRNGPRARAAAAMANCAGLSPGSERGLTDLNLFIKAFILLQSWVLFLSFDGPSARARTWKLALPLRLLRTQRTRQGRTGGRSLCRWSVSRLSGATSSVPPQAASPENLALRQRVANVPGPAAKL